MIMTSIRIIETADGSHSLYDEQLRETYHSTHGAVQESNHVFIKNGLAFLSENKKNIRVLEVGFGTGLNAWLTLQFSSNHAISVRYTTLETHPLKEEIYTRLNFHGEDEQQKTLFEKLHATSWQGWEDINSTFALHKMNCKIQEFQTDEKFDLIYYDAFGPPAQPDMWTAEIFEALFAMMSHGGILVTYCAKGQVRRDLQKAGFSVERLPGPPGKREMLRAVK